MGRKRKQDADQLSPLEAHVSTALLVPGIREKVKAWRSGGYQGISDTTRILLNTGFAPITGCQTAGNLPITIEQRPAIKPVGRVSSAPVGWC